LRQRRNVKVNVGDLRRQGFNFLFRDHDPVLLDAVVLHRIMAADHSLYSRGALTLDHRRVK
jgi:hypothetical protein